MTSRFDCPDATTSTLRLGAKKLGAWESCRHLLNIHKTHLLSQGRATPCRLYVEFRDAHQTEARVFKQRRGGVLPTVIFHTCIFQSLHRLRYSTNIKSYLCMSAASLSTNFWSDAHPKFHNLITSHFSTILSINPSPHPPLPSLPKSPLD